MSDPAAIDETVTRVCQAQEHTELSYPFGPGAAVYKIRGHIFAITTTTRWPTRLTLKCDPDLAEHLTRTHPGVNPGYHMNKRHWISIELDGNLPDDLVTDLIHASYDRVTASRPTPGPSRRP